MNKVLRFTMLSLLAIVSAVSFAQTEIDFTKQSITATDNAIQRICASMQRTPSRLVALASQSLSSQCRNRAREDGLTLQHLLVL